MAKGAVSSVIAAEAVRASAAPCTQALVMALGVNEYSTLFVVFALMVADGAVGGVAVIRCHGRGGMVTRGGGTTMQIRTGTTTQKRDRVTRTREAIPIGF